ncbi:helix-turn-helix domain-containing protein [Clostridium perfringens]|uniref:helix-turn-helix domain-containing protein n=1 Tax=Clostridium perfringens TaxID=1502 RepID=UPI000E49D836|nr:helix-turn-helix transcriptional regulator [Clostridium perfringens]ELC8416824.1 helix-turn-helix transcriptional regulator [Clostridium perfringens]MDU7724882.1 helix-turn-helix transcriptional regulator [Clostridium perfringens]RHN26792.1 XRE family transcriptional regulator [Clostridium perfringens]
MLGKKIKELRLANELTIKDLSKKTGIGQSTISELETGKAKKPRFDTLVKIANVLEVDVNYLLGNDKDDMQIINNPELKEFVDLYLQTDDETKKLIKKLMIKIIK